jgi:hypothetical protein
MFRLNGYRTDFVADVHDGNPCTEEGCQTMLSGPGIWRQGLGSWSGCSGNVCSIGPDGKATFTYTTSTSPACVPSTPSAPSPSDLFPRKTDEIGAAITAQGGTPFDASHGSMLSGRVVDAAGNGVAGVTVSAIGRDTAAGTTSTDANGWYRFAIEGGEPVTLKFAQEGIASVLRVVETRWGSRERLADVVTTPLEAAMNVTLPAAGGSAVVVAAEKLHGVAGATGNKPRRARLIIPPGTTITNAPGLTN